MDKIEFSLQEMYIERNRLIETENYVEAKALTEKIDKYAETIRLNQNKSIITQQIKEKRELEEMFKAEIDQFNVHWTHLEQDLDSAYQEKHREHEENHHELIKAIHEEYQNNYRPRQSPSYLNIKKIQFELAKQLRFSEADDMKKKAEAVLKEENDKLLIEWNNQMKKKLDNVAKKHKVNIDQLIEDRKRKAELLRGEKEKEYNGMMIRFNYRKLELDYQQKTSQKKEQKKLKKILRRKDSLNNNASTIHTLNDTSTNNRNSTGDNAL